MIKIQPKTKELGRLVHYLPSCHSTNDFAIAFVSKNDPPHGTIVITDYQSNGKGQRGNSWESSIGDNLLFSVILKPTAILAQEQFAINMAVSTSLCEAIKEISGVSTQVKWPNDIFYQDQKLAGILIESLLQGKSISHCVVGIGLNINQKQFNTTRATSLSIIKQDSFTRSTILEAFLELLEDKFDGHQLKNIKDLKKLYISNLYGFQEWRKYEDANGFFEGRIVGITQIGEILIEREQGLSKYQMKEFKYIFG